MHVCYISDSNNECLAQFRRNCLIHGRKCCWRHVEQCQYGAIDDAQEPVECPKFINLGQGPLRRNAAPKLFGIFDPEMAAGPRTPATGTNPSGNESPARGVQSDPLFACELPTPAEAIARKGQIGDTPRYEAPETGNISYGNAAKRAIPPAEPSGSERGGVARDANCREGSTNSTRRRITPSASPDAGGHFGRTFARTSNAPGPPRNLADNVVESRE